MREEARTRSRPVRSCLFSASLGPGHSDNVALPSKPSAETNSTIAVTVRSEPRPSRSTRSPNALVFCRCRKLTTFPAQEKRPEPKGLRGALRVDDRTATFVDRRDVAVRAGQDNGCRLVLQVDFRAQSGCKRRTSAGFDDELQAMEGIAYGGFEIAVAHRNRIG